MKKLLLTVLILILAVTCTASAKIVEEELADYDVDTEFVSIERECRHIAENADLAYKQGLITKNDQKYLTGIEKELRAYKEWVRKIANRLTVSQAEYLRAVIGMEEAYARDFNSALYDILKGYLTAIKTLELPEGGAYVVIVDEYNTGKFTTFAADGDPDELLEKAKADYPKYARIAVIEAGSMESHARCDWSEIARAAVARTPNKRYGTKGKTEPLKDRFAPAYEIEPY